jgi:hypothetical protein
MAALADERIVLPVHLRGSRGVDIEQACDAVQEHGWFTFGNGAAAGCRSQALP